jgi:hypothetical protein
VGVLMFAGAAAVGLGDEADDFVRRGEEGLESRLGEGSGTDEENAEGHERQMRQETRTG